jgi:hypothetical protein
LAPGDPGDYNSVDSGNTFGWFDDTGGVPVPALGLAGASVLVLLLLLLGGRALRRRSADTRC